MKPMTVTGCVLALVLFGLSGAEGADWVVVAETDNSVTWVDKQSIRRSPGGMVRAWVRLEQKDPSTSVKEMDAYNDFDCTRAKWRGLGLTIYYRNGTSASAPQEQSWTHITPGTVEKAVFDYLCRK